VAVFYYLIDSLAKYWKFRGGDDIKARELGVKIDSNCICSLCRFPYFRQTWIYIAIKINVNYLVLSIKIICDFSNRPTDSLFLKSWGMKFAGYVVPWVFVVLVNQISVFLILDSSLVFLSVSIFLQLNCH
jgi:hypothetical protein